MTRVFPLILGLFVAVSSVADPACPKGKDEWRDWAKDQAARLFNGDFRVFVVNPVVETVESCKTVLAAAPAIRACVQPLARFAKARWWDFQPAHTMGLERTDRDYLTKVPFPEFLDIPAELKDQEFLSWVGDMADGPALEKALAYVEKLNAKQTDPKLKWITFLYKSQHLPAPDQTSALGRFFVYIPGKDFDRYLQFALRTDKDEDLPNAFSVVSVQKTDPATGKPLDAPRARMKDFWRIRTNKGIQLSTRLDQKGRLENCYQCHKTPLLPIEPDRADFDEKRFGANVKLVNQLMGDHTDLKYDGLNMDDYGPGLGPVDAKTRTKDFMLSCAGGKVTDEKRLEVIAKAMNCQNCHDGSQRGVLNYPSAKVKQPTSQKPLTRHYVVDYEKMPPGEKLSQPEREALHECLRRELYGTGDQEPGLLRSHLQNKACFDAVP